MLISVVAGQTIDGWHFAAKPTVQCRVSAAGNIAVRRDSPGVTRECSCTADHHPIPLLQSLKPYSAIGVSSSTGAGGATKYVLGSISRQATDGKPAAQLSYWAQSQPDWSLIGRLWGGCRGCPGDWGRHDLIICWLSSLVNASSRAMPVASIAPDADGIHSSQAIVWFAVARGSFALCALGLATELTKDWRHWTGARSFMRT